MEDKEVIIKAIAQRIKEEQKKHEGNIPDWHEIAARKIYATFDIKLKPEQPDFIDPWNQSNNGLKNNDSTFYNLLNKQD
jgi:hypothetical protein